MVGRAVQGQIGYLMMEFTHHSSRFFAHEPFSFYITQYALIYGAALPVVGFLICYGARKAPALLVVAVAVLLPFQFVGHKEYRFLIAGLPLLVLLMGLGTSEVLTRVDPQADAAGSCWC